MQFYNYATNKDILIRRKVDYVEYHLLMVQTKLIKNIYDINFKNVQEHVDLCLEAKKIGYDTYIEPSSIITYNMYPLVNDEDIDFFKKRWLLKG